MNFQDLIWRQNLLGWLVRLLYKLLWLKIKSIPDNEILWRKVYNEAHIKPNGILKSSFFRDKRGLSCDLARFTTKKKACKPMGIVTSYIKSPGLVIITIELVRNVAENYTANVIHTPSIEYRNYAHCQLTEKLTEGQAKKLTKNPMFEVRPILK